MARVPTQDHIKYSEAGTLFTSDFHSEGTPEDAAGVAGCVRFRLKIMSTADPSARPLTGADQVMAESVPEVPVMEAIPTQIYTGWLESDGTPVDHPLGGFKAWVVKF